MNGKQVRLFLVEGTTGSLMTAEIINWTGHVISAPRSELSELLRRPEVQSTGVYILIGDDEDGLYESRVYIGEGDAVESRLRSHARPETSGGRDFWNRVVVITSKDANITKAHARYLESRLINLASEARRSALENGTNPPVQLLPEADRSDMEYFIGQLKILLPVLGVQILRNVSTPAGPKAILHDPAPAGSGPAEAAASTQASSSAARDLSPVFKLRVGRNPDRFASAVEVDSEFVVQADSFAKATKGVMMPGYEAKRDGLLKSGLLSPDTSDPGMLRLREDHVFRSPSEAASVMNASSENGRSRWVTDAGMSYGVWQSQSLKAVPPDGVTPDASSPSSD